MRQVRRLLQVGSSAAQAYNSQEEWIHRRVESITFPFPDRPIYRRHISVDFTIPTGLAAAVDERQAPGPPRPPRYYVPLSLVQRWPPLPKLDLRDSRGSPAPFLTARQNAVLDSATLQGLALNLVPAIDRNLLVQIARIAADDSMARRKQALDNLLHVPPAAIQGQSSATTAHQALVGNERFCSLASSLVDHSLLWIRVEGWPEDRTVVKFAYDVPLDVEEFGEWSRPSFGLEPFVFRFEVPHLGDTSSYHCNVVAPPPMEVTRAELVLHEGPAAEDGALSRSQIRHHVDSAQARPRSRSVDLFAGIAGSQAKFYASGDRTGLQGSLYVAILIQSQGLLRGALSVATASLVILTAFTVLLGSALSGREAAVAVLLISPAVLAYVMVRPSEEALSGGLLVGLRRIILLSGVPPIAAATVLTLLASPAEWYDHLPIAALAVIQAVLLAALFWAYRAGESWRQKFGPHPDANLTAR